MEDSIKIEMQKNSLLYLFMNFAHKELDGKISDRECTNLLDWLSVNKTAIENNKISLYKNNSGLVISKRNGISNEENIPVLAYKLRGMLTILLLCKGDVKYTNKYKQTVLHVFVENCSNKNGCFVDMKASKITKMTDNLISQGACVEIPDNKGNTPLHIASKSQNEMLIRTMLNKFENINAFNHRYDSVLHLVIGNSMTKQGKCVEGYVGIVRYLIGNGADLYNNEKGKSPIQLAAELGHHEMLRAIFETIYPDEPIDAEYHNLLVTLCKKIPKTSDDSTKIKIARTIDLLINNGYNVNGKSRNGNTPLHFASRYDSVEVTNLLLRHGADVHATTIRNKLTSLHLASKWASFAAIEALITAGANVNAKSQDDITSLHLAALKNKFEVVKCLIDHGANVCCRESFFGFTILHMVAFHNDKKKFELVVSQDLDVNDGGKYGITPLHIASYFGNIDIVKILIERKKANPGSRDKLKLLTPLHFASNGDFFWNFIGYVLQKDDFNNIRPSWTFVALPRTKNEKKEKKQLETVVTLLKRSGADINCKDAFGRTPLHLATLDPTGILIQRLLSLGAYVDEDDNNGNLPALNVLKTRKDAKALECLVEFGLNINDEYLIQQLVKNRLDNHALDHANKLRAAGLTISKIYKPYLNMHWWQVPYEQCAAEVIKMKSYEIADHVSLYDVLHMNSRRRSAFANCIEPKLETHFPIYFNVLKGSCREAIQRCSLIEPAHAKLYRITGVLWPHVCTDQIFMYLDNKSLRSLVSAGR